MFVFLQPSFMFAMEADDRDDLMDSWVIISDSDAKKQPAQENDVQNLLSQLNTMKEELEATKRNNNALMKANTKALTWAVHHGSPPKMIKLLQPTKKTPLAQALCQSDLDEARKALIKRGGKYCLEDAIASNNLNFVKEFISLDSDDHYFKATAFYLAAMRRSQKIASYLAQDETLFTNHDSIRFLYTIFSEAFEDRALEPITIVFQSNPTLKSKQWKKLIAFGIEEAEKKDFHEAKEYLARVEK